MFVKPTSLSQWQKYTTGFPYESVAAARREVKHLAREYYIIICPVRSRSPLPVFDVFILKKADNVP